MSGVLYLLELLAFGWLVMWTIHDPSRPGSAWWPFDLRDPNAPKPGEKSAAPAPGTPPWRARHAKIARREPTA